MILEKQIKKEREKAALEATIKTVIKISNLQQSHYLMLHSILIS